MLILKEIRRVGENLQFCFADGTEKVLSLAAIRKNCACAVCLEMKVPLHESQPYFKRAIDVKKITPVGNYAIEILWGDGHRSIMAFDRLRLLSDASEQPSPVESPVEATGVSLS